MRWRIATTTLAVSLLALVTIAPAEVAAPDLALLQKVAATYRGLIRYQLSGSVRIVQNAGGRESAQDAPFRVAVGPGGRVRDEVLNPALGGMIVSDGRQTWVYNAALGQYQHRTQPAGAGAGAPQGVGGALMQRYTTIADRVTGVKRLPDETLTLGGRKVACTVLEVGYPSSSGNPAIRESPRTYWVDKATHLVVRQRSSVDADMPQLGGKLRQEETIQFERIALDPALPDSLWVFRPPPGVQKVEAFSGAGDLPDLSGEAAADFALADLDGRQHSLKALRGKVVLLDFWATWCRPCRITMPRVESIRKEFAARGLEVFSINVGEPAQRARDYMKQNGYGVTTLLDTDRQVAHRYKAFSIPTLVVVGRDGIISSYLVGAHPEETIREAVHKAGLR